MHRFLAIILLPIALAACTNPMPFGPGRVEVRLDDVEVAAAGHSAIFPNSISTPTPAPRRTVTFYLSSTTDLVQYFKDWEKEVQVRCSVLGAANGKVYRGFATQPMPRTARAESDHRVFTGPAPERHLYTVYAFVDLTAEEEAYQGGKPASTLNLQAEQFEVISCHLLGVSMSPFLWPRSNDFTLKAEKFQELHRQAHFE